MPKVPIGVLLSLTLAASAPLAAQPQGAVASLEPLKGGGIDVDYAITFWTIPFGHTSVDAHFGRNAYQTSSHFETSGIVSAFWGAIIDANSSGQLTPRGLAPAVYDSYYRRGEEKKQRVRLTYGADGLPALLAEPPYNTARFPVSEEQKKQTLDPLSAVSYVLAAAKADASNPCGKTAPVFDGRRRYNIEFTYLRDEPVKLENGLYDGKAHLCQLHYNQIAGFKPKILKEGRAFPPIYGLFADIPSTSAPNGHYIVALKVWTSTGLGTIAATLSQMKVNDSASRT
ncbi:MAG TPA: DUF3108 domain-containing protein [Rhizomicrobium sp.]|nr:DUF3108 domain-containing protein [Rhizomicrobium sp.]